MQSHSLSPDASKSNRSIFVIGTIGRLTYKKLTQLKALDISGDGDPDMQQVVCGPNFLLASDGERNSSSSPFPIFSHFSLPQH
jgi:hypothetical protein